MVINLEPDILECEVKWVLGSITTNKSSGDNEISAELFKILKKKLCSLNMSANLENSAVATGLEKKLVFITFPKKGIAKECSSYCTIVLISHASKVMLKILQAKL